ncbi:MAG: hypothetical protein QNJ67_02515 [Kiloniellales bacterium]|nr:hypothetical protein [Kiloniellales bacterium]
MAKSHGLNLDLKLVEQPDDLWGRLFFAWVRYLSEQNAVNQERLGALEQAVAELAKAVEGALPEDSGEITKAVSALQETHDHWKEQSKRGLDIVEHMAVILKQISATQKG